MIEKLLNGACRTRLLFECLDDIAELEHVIDRVVRLQAMWSDVEVIPEEIYKEYDALVHMLDVLHRQLEQQRQDCIMDAYLLLQVHRYSNVELQLLL